MNITRTAFELSAKAQRMALTRDNKTLAVAWNQSKMQLISKYDIPNRKYLKDPARWVGLYHVPIDPRQLIEDLQAWQAEHREQFGDVFDESFLVLP